jgi:hypothetical protein
MNGGARIATMQRGVGQHDSEFLAAIAGGDVLGLERHASRRLSDHLTFEGQKQKVHSLVDKVTLSH